MRKDMQISSISIRNFKSIQTLTISEVESAMIIVGKNSTGKTVILDAILAVAGMFKITEKNFCEKNKNIEISITLALTEEDLTRLHEKGAVSKYKRFPVWVEDFHKKLPSFIDGKLTFTFIATKDGAIRYSDGVSKHNSYIKQVLPKVHFIDHERNLEEIQDDIFMAQGHYALERLRANQCMFDAKKQCNNCFQCVGVIEKKQADRLSIMETTKLLEYKLYHLNIDTFVDKLNYYFHKNTGLSHEIEYVSRFNIDEVFHIDTLVWDKERDSKGSASMMSAGTKSIYILSLLEAYIDESNNIPSIIMMEDPEIYLHPSLQKVASEILYRLSKKNQVIFSTHSPNLLFNFNSRQIKQVLLDEQYYTTVKENADIDEVLDDLGYSANDFMNVSFVFIVEGKQDRNRLPLLLEKYYSEIYNQQGQLQRIAIIPTNSCTNIKTYANLKYINKLYLKDQFLMIRDGDGKDARYLKRQLTSYYKEREREDRNTIPRVTEKNVLILKYYSFENYFLEPKVMAQIGVINNEEEFFDILYKKYKDYLYRLVSVKKMKERRGIQIQSKEDLKKYFEEIKIYVRGHNLYDIFYGRYKGEKEQEILTKYIEVAPRETFSDILDSIDSFIFFESKKK